MSRLLSGVLLRSIMLSKTNEILKRVKMDSSSWQTGSCDLNCTGLGLSLASYSTTLQWSLK